MILTLTPLDQGFSGSRLLYASYPFATGFSLRKLRNDYSGNCITVRRSSDSAEIDIGFSPSGRVDTTSLLSFCGAGSGYIRRWYDQSSLVNHAVQSASALQPRIVNSGSLEVNEHGKPVIRFLDPVATGTGHFLEFDPFYFAWQCYVGYYSAYCLVSAGTFPQLIGSSPIDRGLVSLHNSTTGVIRTGTIRSVSTFANGSALSTGTTYVRHDAANRNDLRTFLNKVEAANIDTADSDTDFSMPTKIRIGNTDTASTVVSDICISEVLGYTDYEDNQLTIRSDIYDYWGVA